MINVLFVCLGNICRSPMAEAVFTDLVQKAKLSEQFNIDSAGTIGYHVGEPAHPGTRKILKRYHITYQGRSRKIDAADLTRFDYLITMDSENVFEVQGFATRSEQINKIHKLLDFAQGSSAGDVPDPYYNGNFDYVYALVLDGCQGLLEYIRAEHNI